MYYIYLVNRSTGEKVYLHSEYTKKEAEATVAYHRREKTFSADAWAFEIVKQ